MKKKICILLVLTILFSLICGCSSVISSEQDETTLQVTESTIKEITTAVENASELTTEQITTTTSTAKTTEKQTKASTTNKMTKAQNQGNKNGGSATSNHNKITTTATTSKPVWCDEGGSKHVISVGLGWYSSYNEAKQAGMAHIGNGSGRWEVQECDCGKFTVYVTINETTTSPYYCDEGGSHHRRDVGQIGWCSTREEMFDAISNYISSRELDGKANYTPVKCSCGKYTAYIK